MLKYRENLLLLIFQQPMNQQGSTGCVSLKRLSGSDNSKVNPAIPLNADKLAAAVFLYVFNTGFPASLFPHMSKTLNSRRLLHHWDSRLHHCVWRLEVFLAAVCNCRSSLWSKCLQKALGCYQGEILKIPRLRIKTFWAMNVIVVQDKVKPPRPPPHPPPPPPPPPPLSPPPLGL